MFYGFEHAYGRHVQESDGSDIGQVFMFDTAAKRDTWVRQRYTENSQETGYREAYPARKARRWKHIEYGVVR